MLLGSEAAGEDGSPIMHPTFYDCVFCDNSMPVMTGPQMVAELRRHNRTDLVVGVTGNALKEDQEEFESAGVDL
jgi:CheY-like chemotaxis protein